MWACGWKLFLRRGVALGQGGHHILQAARWMHDDAHTLPKFKNELRRLYKLIHPDLLHNFPTEQVSIQASLHRLALFMRIGDGLETFWLEMLRFCSFGKCNVSRQRTGDYADSSLRYRREC